MRGFDYLETYKKSFNAGAKEEFVRTRVAMPVEDEEEVLLGNGSAPEPKIMEKEVVHEEEKIPITERIKIILSKMFEVEDQPIK
jgi:hypothetical protein